MINDEPMTQPTDAAVSASDNEVAASTTTPEPVAPVTEPTPSPAPVAAADDFDLFAAEMSRLEKGEEDNTRKKINKGDRIEATIIQVEKDRLFVDLGTKSEGVIPLHEVSDSPIENLSDQFSVGDKVHVVVVKPEGSDGQAIVSKKRADFYEVWDNIEKLHREGAIVNAVVVERVKGGLGVDVGVRGFVPATHVGNGKLRNIEKYVGQSLPFKVIEIERERKKVVLSNRLAEEERRTEAKDEIFGKIQPGATLEGTVRRLTDYGAFIDLGGVDGLLHISEMSWMRINHPREMFKEGQAIQVMVLRLDSGAGKISLGHRQVLPDPWNLIKQNYRIGQKMTVTIGRMVPNGAFVRLAEGAEAFIPVSEMSTRRIKKPEEVLSIDQEIEVQVIDLRTDERRMVLSLRAAGSSITPADSPAGSSDNYGLSSSYDDDRRGAGGGFKKAGAKGGKKGSGGRGRDRGDDDDDFGGRGRGFGSAGGATIGERLGMLKGLLREDVEDLDKETSDKEADKDAE